MGGVTTGHLVLEKCIESTTCFLPKKRQKISR